MSQIVVLLNRPGPIPGDRFQIPFKSSKREVRMEYELDSDRLSNLPLGIIHAILARVPIKDAIRTSLLSRQWRYTWASLPQLVFSSYCVSNSGDDATDEKRLVHFITRALLHHEGPIHGFEISVDITKIQPKIDRWVHFLSRNDIRELIMNFTRSCDDLHLHSSIYFCEKLTRLRLWRCNLDPPPPAFKGFLFLKSLVLHHTYLSPDELNRLVASCPLLERLELNTWEEQELRISALNLKYLDLDGQYFKMSVYAPLLAEIKVLSYFAASDISQESESSLCNYTNFFGGCTNLEKLIGFGYFTMFLSMGIEFCSHSVLLSNLKIVDLEDVKSQDIKEIMAVARLIMGAPNLNQLKIKFEIGDDESEDGNVCIRDFFCAHNFSFEKLRFIRISDLNALFPEKELIRFLLESSPVLETMRIGHYRLDINKIQSVVDDLLGCCRASPSARISISHGSV